MEGIEHKEAVKWAFIEWHVSYAGLFDLSVTSERFDRREHYFK